VVYSNVVETTEHPLLDSLAVQRRDCREYQKRCEHLSNNRARPHHEPKLGVHRNVYLIKVESAARVHQSPTEMNSGRNYTMPPLHPPRGEKDRYQARHAVRKEIVIDVERNHTTNQTREQKRSDMRFEQNKNSHVSTRLANTHPWTQCINAINSSQAVKDDPVMKAKLKVRLAELEEDLEIKEKEMNAKIYTIFFFWEDAIQNVPPSKS